jgi:hypothetical protein
MSKANVPIWVNTTEEGAAFAGKEEKSEDREAEDGTETTTNRASPETARFW